MRPPRAYLVVQRLFEVYAAVLLGLVILAVLIPAVVSAREAVRRAVCKVREGHGLSESASRPRGRETGFDPFLETHLHDSRDW